MNIMFPLLITTVFLITAKLLGILPLCWYAVLTPIWLPITIMIVLAWMLGGGYD